MSFQLESGHNGLMISMGGILGRPGLGRRIDSTAFSLTTTAVMIIGDNPRRISAIIENQGPDSLALDFGGGINSISIHSGGNLQIDENFPYTGSIAAGADTSTCVVLVTEISVQ